MPRKRSSTKDRIIKAAWTLFYKKGYDDTTIADIIALSKTSKGTFYHYFKGKEALLNTISDLFDSKYEELLSHLNSCFTAYQTLLYLNRKLFEMIESSIDVKLIASLYSSQLITKDSQSLLDQERVYFVCLSDIIGKGIESGEFYSGSSTEELVKIYAMYERAIIYDWALCKGKYSLSEYSARLLPHVLDTFVSGI
nr:TetR/AcrR family transcriptional regulator [uncultured Sellimonas sp.]